MQSKNPSGCPGVTIGEWCNAGMRYADPGEILKTSLIPCSVLEADRVALWLSKSVADVKAAAKAAKVRGLTDGGKPVLAVKLGIYHKLPAETPVQAGSAAGGASKAKAGAPAAAPAKKRAKPTPAAAAASKAYALTCERDGETLVSHHETAAVAAQQAWAWAEREGLELLAGEWDVRTAKYGWQDAANIIISVEGQNWEPETEFLKCVRRMLARTKFEAAGEESRITIEKTA